MAEKQTGFHPTNQGALEVIDEAPIARSTFGDAELLRVSVQVARQHPRDEMSVLRVLLATIERFPEFAAKAIYEIEYKDARARSGKAVVTGMSVRAAETIAAEWGNFWVAATITGETDDFVDVQAVAFDAQKNSVVRLPFRVSRFEKQREGGFRVLDDRRFLMALQSGVSKARRNAVLAVLPLHIKEAFNKAVREALAGGDLFKPADPDRVVACLAAYQETFTLGLDRLEGYVGKPRAGWTGRDLSRLRTLYNALEDGEAAVADTFPLPEAPPAATPTGTVVSATEGHLGSAAGRPDFTIKMESQALRDYQNLPAEKPAKPLESPQATSQPVAKVETPAPPPVVVSAPVAAPQPDELARLRAALAEAEAKLAQAPAVVLVTEAAPEPVEHAVYNAEAHQRRMAKAPDPIFDRPAPAPVLAPTAQATGGMVHARGEDAELAALAQQAEACATIEALDQLLGRMYAPGGTLEKAARAKKQAVLRLIGARRDALQAAG